MTVEPDLPQTVRLMAGADPRGGVVRITVFEEQAEAPGEPKPDLKPVAERLVFRKPGEVLNLAFGFSNAQAGALADPAPKGAAFAAGAAVNLSVTATDEKGNPAAAVLWAAACNSGAAPGPKDRLLPTHFLLGGEVKNPDDLEYADFLLTDHPKAGEALDLVLGTQGWRRFAEQSHAPALAAQKPAAANAEVARLMVQNGQYATWTESVPLRDHRRLFETYAPLYEAAVKAVTRAKAELDAARDETFEVNAIGRAERAASEANRAAAEKARAAAAEAARADAAREPVRQFRAGVWYGVAGLAALALCCGLVALRGPTAGSRSASARSARSGWPRSWSSPPAGPTTRRPAPPCRRCRRASRRTRKRRRTGAAATAPSGLLAPRHRRRARHRCRSWASPRPPRRSARRSPTRSRAASAERAASARGRQRVAVGRGRVGWASPSPGR